MQGIKPFKNALTTLLKVEYPIIQAGMIWASSWELASAVSNAGGLGIIGAGSMHAPNLENHIRKCKAATDKPFAVNMPLLHPEIKEHMEIVIKEGVQVVVTSAGSPKTWTKILKQNGVKVIHVISSSAFAVKAQESGCDAVVAEGFEAGGHNGREETTTLVLVPGVANAVTIPVIAAGGISNGRSMAAAMILGAQGVQMGTRFILSEEASCHPDFKKAVLNADEGDTHLMMKNVMPVRLLKNQFFDQVADLEKRGATKEEMMQLLGRGRSKKGMFLGMLEEGELEIGQVCARIDKIEPAGDIVKKIWSEFQEVCENPFPQLQ